MEYNEQGLSAEALDALREVLVGHGNNLEDAATLESLLQGRLALHEENASEDDEDSDQCDGVKKATWNITVDCFLSDMETMQILMTLVM